jgi:hypothetical protein
MIWLTWRQFRAQLLVVVVALGVVALVFGLTGPGLAHLYDTSGLLTCHKASTCAALKTSFLNAVKTDTVYPALTIIGAALLYAAPVLIGAFLGAPLVSREFETGTFRLAWHQSVTRVRWLAVKLAIIGLVAIATGAILSIIVTWWSSPVDHVGGMPLANGQLGRFSPLIFGARDVVPPGYFAFGFTFGVLVSLLVRRTLPAMAITLACVALVLLAWPNFVRPHLISPVSTTTPITVNLTTAVVNHNGEVTMPVTDLPGAWIVSNETLTPNGSVFVLPTSGPCAGGSTAQCNAWFATQHLRRQISYQPATRYWSFQWAEVAIFLALSFLLAALSMWWIKRWRVA